MVICASSQQTAQILNVHRTVDPKLFLCLFGGLAASGREHIAEQQHVPAARCALVHAKLPHSTFGVQVFAREEGSGDAGNTQETPVPPTFEQSMAAATAQV